jgi:hypothetical protein
MISRWTENLEACTDIFLNQWIHNEWEQMQWEWEDLRASNKPALSWSCTSSKKPAQCSCHGKEVPVSWTVSFLVNSLPGSRYVATTISARDREFYLQNALQGSQTASFDEQNVPSASMWLSLTRFIVWFHSILHIRPQTLHHRDTQTRS